MICLCRIGCNNHENANDAAEHEGNCEPRVIGERAVGSCYRGSYEGDEPGELCELISIVLSRDLCIGRIEYEKGHRHTIAIDTVANAKGSPRILSVLIPRRAPVLLPLLSIPPFILRSDGE